MGLTSTASDPPDQNPGCNREAGDSWLAAFMCEKDGPGHLHIRVSTELQKTAAKELVSRGFSAGPALARGNPPSPPCEQGAGWVRPQGFDSLQQPS